MLHEKQGGLLLLHQLLHLPAGKQVDEVKRLVPDEKMGRPAEAGRKQHLFLLPLAQLGQVAGKDLPPQVQFPQDGQE